MLENGDYIEPLKYDVDGFVADAVSLKITPFMLDCYRHEYEDMVREANKHAMQIDELRNNNRALSQQWLVVEVSPYEVALKTHVAETWKIALPK
ncbi:hypothetical protein Ac2012v2_004944 [Leucoagaricus gongylophorus]